MRHFSLKWIMVAVVLLLALVLISGYSLLSARYFMLGMDNAIAGNMERLAKLHSKGQQHIFTDYQVTTDWLQQPDHIRQAIGSAPPSSGALHKAQHSERWLKPSHIYFAMRYDLSGTPYFISHKISPEQVSSLLTANVKSSFDFLLLLSCGSLLLIAAVIWLLLQRLSQPVKALGHWAGSLTPVQLQQPPPDFRYRELNQLAGIIRNSLSTVQESLDREQHFLRHTSHELRTPISVIRNNIELLHRLAPDTGHSSLQRQQSIERIDRASLTMKHLTETLLWLNRSDTETLPLTPLRLDSLVLELVEELRYLIQGKPVELAVHVDQVTLTLAATPVRIVLGNLIRNALQHTWQGSIQIRQSQNRIEIINQQTEDATDAATDLGFGLGLQLTEQLTQRLGWPCQQRINPNGRQVTLLLHEVTTAKAAASSKPLP